jgi:hypothetical protein
MQAEQNDNDPSGPSDNIPFSVKNVPDPGRRGAKQNENKRETKHKENRMQNRVPAGAVGALQLLYGVTRYK